MNRPISIQAPARAVLMLALATPGAVFAYGNNDAIRDCEGRIRSEYGLTDVRDSNAQALNDSPLHFKVQGLTKIDGQKYPWNCEVKNRHVTTVEYTGPKPKGMSTAGKIAIGTAAAVAGGLALNQMSQGGATTQAAAGASGAKGLQDLVGARAAGGEAELQRRGYTYASGSKGGDSSYTNWRKGSQCVTVRTTNGHYASIVDVTMLDCNGGQPQAGGSSGKPGAAGLQDLVGARGSSGEAELESRGYGYVSGNKVGASSYTKYSNGTQCVTVRTTDGRYKSIVDTPMAQCH